MSNTPHIHRWLNRLAELHQNNNERRSGWKYNSVEAMILDAGVEFTPQSYPKDWPRGKPRECFRNAIDLRYKVVSMRLPSYNTLHYAEGYAYSARTDLVTLHGWCVDDDGRVYDPTWDTPGRNEYLGFVISAVEFVQRAEQSGGTLPLLLARRNLIEGWPLGDAA